MSHKWNRRRGNQDPRSLERNRRKKSRRKAGRAFLNWDLCFVWGPYRRVQYKAHVERSMPTSLTGIWPLRSTTSWLRTPSASVCWKEQNNAELRISWSICFFWKCCSCPSSHLRLQHWSSSACSSVILTRLLSDHRHPVTFFLSSNLPTPRFR